MLIQQFQRPTRLLAVFAAVSLVYLCLSYLQHIDFTACSIVPPRTVNGKFGTTEQILAQPATLSNRPAARVAKVGVAVNALDIPVVYRAFKSHKVQNDMHGYPHFIADSEVVSSLTDNDVFRRGSGTYTKPAYMLAIMIAELLKPESERLEWLFWFDGDTAILNPSTPLEVFLPPNSSAILNDVHVVIASNWDGLNSGAFALRVHKWTASFLSAVLAYPIYERERTKHDRFRDQSAFQFLLKHGDSPLAHERFQSRNHWAEVPMRWFNSLPVNNAFYADGRWLFSKNMTEATFDNGTTQVYDDGRDGKVQAWKVMRGDMMVHFAGTKNVRDSWMSPWLDRAEQMLPEWNNATYSEELANTTAAWWKDYETKAKALYEAPAPPPAKEKPKEKPKEEKPKEEKPKEEKPKEEKQEEKPKEQKQEDKSDEKDKEKSEDSKQSEDKDKDKAEKPLEKQASEGSTKTEAEKTPESVAASPESTSGGQQ